MSAADNFLLMGFVGEKHNNLFLCVEIGYYCVWIFVKK